LGSLRNVATTPTVSLSGARPARHVFDLRTYRRGSGFGGARAGRGAVCWVVDRGVNGRLKQKTAFRQEDGTIMSPTTRDIEESIDLSCTKELVFLEALSYTKFGTNIMNRKIRAPS
jgi:hypothetical protein